MQVKNGMVDKENQSLKSASRLYLPPLVDHTCTYNYFLVMTAGYWLVSGTM